MYNKDLKIYFTKYILETWDYKLIGSLRHYKQNLHFDNK